MVYRRYTKWFIMAYALIAGNYLKHQKTLHTSFKLKQISMKLTPANADIVKTMCMVANANDH